MAAGPACHQQHAAVFDEKYNLAMESVHCDKVRQDLNLNPSISFVIMNSCALLWRKKIVIPSAWKSKIRGDVTVEISVHKHPLFCSR